jgi:hypothetical protein
VKYGSCASYGKAVYDEAIIFIETSTFTKLSVIVLYPLGDEWDEAEWLQAAARNPAFAFLNDPKADIYSLTDGKPFHDEV